ncbi:MAG: hypothetical protein OIF50_12310 [Flavobacteriaceae bacterium]|nr:hypothetical protein [Flavobacteriaceae bacterium]
MNRSYQIIIIYMLLFQTNMVCSQEIISELMGFKLRQYKEAVYNAFDGPNDIQEYEDGFRSETYYLDNEGTASLVFEYPSWNPEVIYSIEIIATDTAMDPQFKGLCFGMHEFDLYELFGKPTKMKYVGSHGNILQYRNTNYCFRLDANGNLSGIKIIDKDNYLLQGPKKQQAPDIQKLKEILNLCERETLSNFISPELEIYMDKKTLFFAHPWQQEIEHDTSSIYQTILEITQDLHEMDWNDKKKCRIKTRWKEKYPTYVFQYKSKFKWKEIVMKWENGGYRIWEIWVES